MERGNNNTGNTNTQNLLRHLWLLHLPGLVAVAIYLKTASVYALIYLGLEFWLVLSALMAVIWMPAHVVPSLPRPRLDSWALVQLALYVLAGALWLVVAWLVLGLAMDRKGADKAKQV